MKKQTPETLEPFNEAEYLAKATAKDAQTEVQRWMDDDERARIIMEGLKPIADLPEVEPVTDGNPVEIQFDSEETPVEVRHSEA